MSQFVRSGQMIGPYQITQRIWEGTFSTAWQARHPKGDPVVIQVIENSSLRQQLQESPITPPKLVNPCLAKLFAIYSPPLAFVWQALSGRKLSEYVDQLGKIKPGIAIFLARRILEIIQSLEQRQQFHGGLRPQRIFITPEKKVVIAGFPLGQAEQRLLSKMYHQGDNMDYLSHILPYFAPEILEEEGDGNISNDIYSIGMLLTFMLTGQIVPASDLISLLHRCQIETNLASVILKATTKNIQDRYTTQGLFDDLTQLLKQDGHAPKIYVPPPRNDIALEAVKADSQEFRIIQAKVISAKQAIDAGEVTAVPVEWGEESSIKRKIQADAISNNSPVSLATAQRTIPQQVKLPSNIIILLKYTFAILGWVIALVLLLDKIL